MTAIDLDSHEKPPPGTFWTLNQAYRVRRKHRHCVTTACAAKRYSLTVIHHAARRAENDAALRAARVRLQ